MQVNAIISRYNALHEVEVTTEALRLLHADALKMAERHPAVKKISQVLTKALKNAKGYKKVTLKIEKVTLPKVSSKSAAKKKSKPKAAPVRKSNGQFTKGNPYRFKKGHRPARAKKKNSVGKIDTTAPRLGSDLKLMPTRTFKTNKPSSKAVMGLGEIANEQYATLDWGHPWTELIGEACHPTHIFIMGPGGCGKSGATLKLSEDLSKLGMKVLYVSGEQYGTPTFSKLIRDTGIDTTNPNIVGTNNVNPSIPEKNPANYDVVVFDSKDDMNIEVREFERLKKQYPETAFILLSQSNKDGSYTGAGKWRNVVDVMLEAYERGKMRTGEKNRWGKHGDVTLFGDKQDSDILTPEEEAHLITI
ncbi:MAG: hypothetical protein ACFB2Y_09835 [Fulvivirga sp.]